MKTNLCTHFWITFIKVENNQLMVISSDPAWIQGAFDALVTIFDRVGLLTNFGKTVSIVCHPCRAGAGNRAEEAYGRRITGVGRSYAER